jgi:class 3 adenylate cyclase
MTEAFGSRLPAGTVTFLFSDVEGSTERLQRLGDRYRDELEAHHRILREAIQTSSGEIVDRHGEEVFAVFARARDAVAAAVEIQRRHSGGALRVRLGLHTGEPAQTGEGYLGLDVHRAARICAAGHGGQILASQTTLALVAGVAARDLGEYALKGIPAPERIYELPVPGLARSFPPLRADPAGRKRRADRPGKRGLRERAWAVRAALPATPEPERAAVARLGAALFQAEHADRDAAAFLRRIDRRDIERRLKSYRGMSLNSRRAAWQAGKLEQSVQLLDSLAAARETLLTVGCREPPDAHEISEATKNLDQLLDEARETIGDSAERLRRTLSPGVYRSPSGEYVVLAYDTAGIERRHHFKTRREARAYRKVVREADTDWRLSYEPSRAGHAGGGGSVGGASGDPGGGGNGGGGGGGG